MCERELSGREKEGDYGYLEDSSAVTSAYYPTKIWGIWNLHLAYFVSIAAYNIKFSQPTPLKIAYVSFPELPCLMRPCHQMGLLTPQYKALG